MINVAKINRQWLVHYGLVSNLTELDKYLSSEDLKSYNISSEFCSVYRIIFSCMVTTITWVYFFHSELHMHYHVNHATTYFCLKKQVLLDVITWYIVAAAFLR